PRLSLPDVTEDFAAHLGLPGLAIGEDTPRRRQDRHAHPAEDARNPVRRDIEPPPRLGDPAEPGDDPFLSRPVLQVDAKDALLLVLDDAEILDEALLLQDLDDPHL